MVLSVVFYGLLANMVISVQVCIQSKYLKMWDDGMCNRLFCADVIVHS